MKKGLSSQRRRPVKTVQTLTSSKFAEKYDLLVEQRLILVKKQIDAIAFEKKLKEEKHIYEVENLKLELEIKKRQLNNI